MFIAGHIATPQRTQSNEQSVKISDEEVPGSMIIWS